MFAFYKSILPEAVETVNCIKKYSFIECGSGKWRNGFTELRKLGHRFTIKHTINNNFHVTNIEDMETYCKNFLRLNGY